MINKNEEVINNGLKEYIVAKKAQIVFISYAMLHFAVVMLVFI
jgi:hypothetical protein